jgi:Gluconate 2-dehydrogenase subunit 3
MSKHWITRNISRRRMLSVLAGSGYSAKGILLLSADASAASHVHKPVQVATSSQTAATDVFSRHQMDTIAALSEAIIPTDGHSAGAKAAGVNRYIAEIVSASQETTKNLWIEGLAAIDRLAKRECGKNFVDCPTAQQAELLGKISQREEDPSTLEERFFVVVKQSTVDGYYLSDIGVHQELEYQGNKVLAEFPGCTHEKHKRGQR